MATFVSDNFDTIGTADIFDRTPDVSTIGAVWRRQSGQGFDGDGAGRVRPTTDGCAASIDTGASDLDISVDLIWVSAVSRFSVGAMTDSVFNPTDKSGYLVWNTDASNIRLSWFNSSGTRTDYSTVSLGTALVADTTYTLRLLVSGTSVKFYINGVERISQTDANVSVRPHACLGGTGVGAGYDNTRYDNFVVSSVAGDVTAPTLTSATATATSATTATGGVTTTEAGPAWAVLTTSSTTPSAAQIKAGQNHTGAAASASATATLAVGANSGVFSFTGLTAGQTYWLHVVQDDTATPSNTSTPITSASSITTPTPDTTPPTMNGSITVGTKTSGSISISYPAASDNVAVTGYEVSSNGTSWSDNGTSLSYTFLGLSALTSYTLYVRAYDAAGNRAATPLAATTSTYRAGDTAANILANTGPVGGNPAGFLYAFASTVSGTDWLSYTITSGPTPSGGTLTANPDGTFTYVGPDAATMVIQPEVNGANAPETITVTLYDNSVSLGAASMASTPTYGSGPVSQAAPVPLTGTAVAVASAYGSGQIAQGAPVVLAGAAFAVIPAMGNGAVSQGAPVALSGAALAVVPAMGAGGLVQGVPVALSAASFVVTPVFSAGALSQAAPVALMGAALSVSTAYGPGAISDAPTFTSMAPSPVCATYRRDSYPAHTFQKLAGETLDFDIDFRYELRSTQDSARIHDPVEIQAGQGVDVLGAYWVPGLRRVKLWVAGGVAQGKSDISIWLNTAAGRRLQVDVRVQIK